MKTMLICLFAGALSLPAAVLQVDLLGRAGPGLLAGNENPAATNGTVGSGGVIGPGITFDDVTKVLAINVGWGSGNGFTDLTGIASVAHIHGPTASTGVAAFSENAPSIITLPLTSNSASNGSITGFTTILNASQETALNNGQLYINVHTDLNGPGEIRGNLVVIPEPATALLGLLGLAGILRRRR